MKWPNELTLIRHLPSKYNVLKAAKLRDPRYQEFLRRYEQDWRSEYTLELAEVLRKKYALNVSDAETPIVPELAWQAEETARNLSRIITLPDLIVVSPYLRAKKTLEHLIHGWPELGIVETVPDERVREQEHGLLLLYNDWKIFTVFYPEQRFLREQEGDYRYRFPQGESALDVRERNRSWIGTIIREFSGRNILTVNHHLSILANMSILDRWPEEKYLAMDRTDKPINCGVTHYRGDPARGKDGKLILDFYNRKLFNEQ